MISKSQWLLEDFEFIKIKYDIEENSTIKDMVKDKLRGYNKKLIDLSRQKCNSLDYIEQIKDLSNKDLAQFLKGCIEVSFTLTEMIIEDLGERVNLIENNKYNRTLLDAILEADHDYPEVFNTDLFCLVANKTNYEILNLLDEDNYNLFHKIIIEGYGRDNDDIYRMLNFILPKVNPNLINQQSKNGKTVLHCVISSPVYGNVEIYKFLLNNMDIKAINYKDDSGKTALYYAVISRDLELIELLLQHMDYIDKTELELALKKDRVKANTKIISLIIDKIDTDIFNQQDTDGKTFLHYAVIARNLSLVELLLQHMHYNAIKVKDNESKTSIDYIDKKELGIFLLIKKRLADG